MDLKIAQQMTINELVLENQKLKLDAQREAEHHDRMVGELEKVYKERDDEREKAERYRIDANSLMLQRDNARFALQELWQTADAYIPQIDEEQAAKWHQAMFGDSDK